MSNSAVVRAVRRRISFYLNSPVFNKYGRSLRDFLTTNQGVGGSNPPRSAIKTPYVSVNKTNTLGSIFLSPNMSPKKHK